MKICQVLSSRGAGGLERHYVDLCNALAEDHELIAIAHPEFHAQLSARVRFEPLDMSGWRRHPLTLLRLYRALRRHRPQLVHVQANKAAAMVGRLRPWLDAATVATVHNLKRDTRMFRGYDALIAVSKQVGAQLDHPRVAVIYNGIVPAAGDAAAGARALRDLTGGDARPVVAVGRLVPAKGFDQLLRAWVEVPAPLVIVGDGPQRARRAELIDTLRLGDRVRLAGFRRDVSDLLAAAACLVIASRNEGFPYVLVEGLHARCVLVATRVPGALDIVPPQFLVDYAAPAALAAAVNQVLHEPAAARAAMQPAWDYAAQELTLARMADKTAQLYAEILHDRGAAA